MWVDGLVVASLHCEEGFGCLVFALFGLVDIAVEEKGLMESLLGLLGVGTLLPAVLLLRFGFLFFVRLGFGVFVGGVGLGLRVTDGFVMGRDGLVATDQFVFVAEYFLFGLEELEVGGSSLR
jgi:hypothetical protein